MKTKTATSLHAYKLQNADQKLVLLYQAIQKKDIKMIRNWTLQSNELDIANWMGTISANEQVFFLRSLDNFTASEIFNQLSPEIIKNIINAFTKKETKELISYLYSDDIVELIEDLPSNLVTKIIESTSAHQRKDINYILHYQEGTVGYEMNVNFISFQINDKIAKVYEKIETHATKPREDLQFYYVVDEKGVLIGYISVQNLLRANLDKSKLLASVLETDVISVRASDSNERAVEKITKYQLTTLPVVDSNNKLVGILTSDEALELVQEQFADDINKQAGVIQDYAKKYFDLQIWSTYISRIPWLIITFLITILSQLFFSLWLNDFDDQGFSQFKWFKFIVPFIPFILTIIGNIALQSTAVVVKGLTLKEIKNTQYLKVLSKEIVTTWLIFLTITLFNFPRTIIIDLLTNKNVVIDSIFWIRFGQITFIIFLAMFLAVFFAISLPIMANYFGFDPALMSSPLLTTIIDFLVTGIAIGFSYLIYQIF